MLENVGPITLISTQHSAHLYLQWSTRGISLAGGLPSVSYNRQTLDKSPWTCLTLLCCCFSVTDPLRLPGLVFSVLCIHQLRSFPGQKNQRVPFWTGSVTREHREGPEAEDEDNEDSERLSEETFGTGTLKKVLGCFHTDLVWSEPKFQV